MPRKSSFQESRSWVALKKGSMRLLVITGLSGSGKTSAVHALEDVGCFCVDNLPIVLLPGLVHLLQAAQKPITRLAVVMDVREAGFLKEYRRIFRELQHQAIQPEILFLEAPVDILLRRFEETRRPHPLNGERSLLDAIESERRQLAELREIADRVMDTSSCNIHQLRQSLKDLYGESTNRGDLLQIELISFSYAKGIPLHADMILDVRFLPNPHYEPNLKERDGRDPHVLDYIQRDTAANSILAKLLETIQEMAVCFRKSDRAYFVLGIGCTGGRHRSVGVVSKIEERLRSLGYAPKVLHRDL
jgi:UPF0042 nucleotide-binding protein